MEEGEVGVLFRFEVVNGDALKIGNNEVAGAIFALPGFLQSPDVGHGLGAGFPEVFARALVLNEEGAGPQEVNAAPVARELLYRLLEAGDHPALDSEDIEEVIPKGLALGGFPRLAHPLLREGDGAVFDFVPGEGHCPASCDGGGMENKPGRKLSRQSPPTRLPAPGKATFNRLQFVMDYAIASRGLPCRMRCSNVYCRFLTRSRTLCHSTVMQV